MSDPVAVGPGAAPPVHTGPLHEGPRPRAAQAARPAQATPGISARPDASAPAVVEPAKPLPKPHDTARAAEAALHLLRAARADLAALDAAPRSVGADPRAADAARAAQERQLTILQKAAIAATTANSKKQMNSVATSVGDMKTASGDKDRLRARQNLRGAREAFDKACLNAEDAVRMQKEAERTLEGDAKAARANFDTANWKVMAAEIVYRDENGVEPSQAATDTALTSVSLPHLGLSDAHLTAAALKVFIATGIRRRQAADDELTASQAWADRVKNGSPEDRAKSEAWVKQAGDHVRTSNAAPLGM
jgi:hypothetical protein